MSELDKLGDHGDGYNLSVCSDRECESSENCYHITESELHDIRRQALEEAIECAPKGMWYENGLATSRTEGYNQAISDYQSNIKKKLYATK